MKLRVVHLWTAMLLAGAATGAAAAGSATVSVGATVLSKNQCKFNSGMASLSFGTVSPLGAAAATASTTISLKCGGSAPNATFSITQDGGLYNTGPSANRMRNTTVTTQFMPYSFAVSPASATVAKNVNQTITISGSIAPVDYQNAYVGSYSDTVVITLLP